MGSERVVEIRDGIGMITFDDVLLRLFQKLARLQMLPSIQKLASIQKLSSMSATRAWAKSRERRWTAAGLSSRKVGRSVVA